MAPELSPFAIKTTVIEPGYFRTNFLNPEGRVKSAMQMKEYDETAVGQTRQGLDAMNGRQPDDVLKGAKVIVDVLTSSGSAEGRNVPERLALGSDADVCIRRKLSSTEKLLDEWKDITTTTDHAE